MSMRPALQQALEGTWDVVVIGTGIGGGTAGRALAEAGQRVLFLELGAEGPRRAVNPMSPTPLPEARLARGAWPLPMSVRLNGRDLEMFPPIGAGLGGSSVFYAATLERPERHDLEALPDRPHPTGGWPVTFDEMQPWFAKAASWYHLYGTDDPLSDATPLPLRAPPQPRTPVEDALFDGLRKAGLHPYHAHTAMARLPGCQGCTGHKCPRACKMDGRSAGVEPALATGNAHLLDRAEVTRLIAEGAHITGIELRCDGALHLLRAPRVVLAAGALSSPRLLLASADAAHPKGLANGSDQVGRNLMFHFNEMFALWPARGTPPGPATKAISLRDLYHAPGARMGTIQSMGLPAGYGEITYHLGLMAQRTPLRHLPGLGLLIRLAAATAVRLFGGAQIFVGLLEDLPYPDNRVTLDPDRPDRITVQYDFAPELLSRRRRFRRAILRRMRGMRRVLLGALPEPNLGHACGTLRMGHDPLTSVVRADGRAHEIDNLWVADASFMPTSMGVNPSLTIAAHALRVADGLIRPTQPQESAHDPDHP